MKRPNTNPEPATTISVPARPARDETDRALSFIPCLLRQLDAGGREMFGQVLQAMLDVGYCNGFNDAEETIRARDQESR